MTHTTQTQNPETETPVAAAATTDVLSAIQQRFCHEYIRDFNVPRAAERAGYSPSFSRTKVYNLLKNPDIARYINLLVYKVRQDLQISPSKIVREIAAIAFANPMDYIDIVEETQKLDGKTTTIQTLKIKPLDQIPESAKGAISEIRQTKTGVVIKMHNKLAALTALGKHLGCFKDFIEKNRKLDEEILYVFQPDQTEMDLPTPTPPVNSDTPEYLKDDAPLSQDPVYQIGQRPAKTLLTSPPSGGDLEGAEGKQKVSTFSETEDSSHTTSAAFLKSPQTEFFNFPSPTRESARRADEVGEI